MEVLALEMLLILSPKILAENRKLSMQNDIEKSCCHWYRLGSHFKMILAETCSFVNGSMITCIL